MSKTFISVQEFSNQIPEFNPFQEVNQLLGPITNFGTTLDMTDTAIWVYYQIKYGDRLIGYPNTGNLNYIFLSLVNYVVRTNKNKYLAALKMYQATYNPIENYSMTEKEASGSKKDSLSSKSDGSGSNNGSSEGSAANPLVSSTNVVNTTSTYESTALRNESGSTTNYTYSNGGVSSSSSSTSSSSTQTANNSSTFSNTKETSLGVDYAIGSNNEVNDRVLTRKGNIGVTTSQQMLQSEIELKSYNVIDEFFKDVNKEVLLGCFRED